MKTPRLFLVSALALAGCGGAPAPRAATEAPTSQEAVATAGDVTMRATAMPTASLDAAVARRYGINRSDETALVLVSVQNAARGDAAPERAVVNVRASDLRGNTFPVEMRELRAGGELSYVGTVSVDPPDTLRFDIDIRRADGGSSSMQLSREFFPR